MTTKTFLLRAERLAWYAFVATAAWQTRLVMWHAGAQFVEWNSASLYFSDVCMVVLFVLAAVRARGFSPWRIEKIDWLLVAFCAIAALSLFHADQITVGVYQLGRLAQFILFYLYVRRWAFQKFNADATAAAFVVGALFQAVLGSVQYAIQRDVGLRWLGETLLRPDMRGVAVFFNDAGVKILRAYGTLPHPNILAAYLMVALWVTAWLWIRHENAKSPVWAGTMILLLWGFYLTFSRTMIAVWITASISIAIVLFLRRISGRWPQSALIRRCVIRIALLVVAVSLVFAATMWPQVHARISLSSSDEAVQLRLDYARDSLSSGSGPLHLNWFGVGIGNFTSWLARTQPLLPSFYIQPAHNVYLLVYSELGVFGTCIFIAWLVLVFRTAWRAHDGQPALRMGILALFAAMLIIGIFDHFFWTLQQGRILWWSVCALAVAPW